MHGRTAAGRKEGAIQERRTILSRYLTPDEYNEFIEKARSGDNLAWEKLSESVEEYIHSCCWKRLQGFAMNKENRMDLEEDLYMAGMYGFVQAMNNFDPESV